MTTQGASMSRGEAFSLGWSSFSLMEKATISFGGVCAGLYVAGATGSAALAFAEAAHELKDGSRFSPIIGHGSEWSMLAIYSGIVFLRLPERIIALGRNIADGAQEEKSGLGFWQCCKKGFQQLTWKSQALWGTGACFLTAQVANYGFGIVSAVNEAYNVYQDGGNPSIIGHAFEWVAEAVAVGNLGYQILGSLAKQGESQIQKELMQEKIEISLLN